VNKKKSKSQSSKETKVENLTWVEGKAPPLTRQEVVAALVELAKKEAEPETGKENKSD
jgi:hypothetical protein